MRHRRSQRFTYEYHKLAIGIFYAQGLFSPPYKEKTGTLKFLSANGKFIQVNYTLVITPSDMDGSLYLEYKKRHEDGSIVYWNDSILLEAIEARKGGLRWYFSAYDENQDTKRYSVLYMSEQWGFYSRDELSLTYESKYMNAQQIMRRRMYQVDIEEAETLFETIKYPIRNGVATRKMRRYQKKLPRIEGGEQVVLKENEKLNAECSRLGLWEDFYDISVV